MKRLYKYALGHGFFTWFIGPGLATAAVIYLFGLFGYRADSHSHEAIAAAVTFAITLAIVQSFPYLAIMNWLHIIRDVQKITKDRERPLLVNMANARLFELRSTIASLLEGQFVPDPPAAAASYFKSFFEYGGSTYVGIDSHRPWEYMETFDWFLSLHQAQITRDGRRRLDARIVVAEKNDLTHDYLHHAEAYLSFVRWHAENGVQLSWIDPQQVARLRAEHGIPPDVDVAIWRNYAVTFSEPRPGALSLALTFPDGQPEAPYSWASLRDFVLSVQAGAEPLTEGPPGLDVVDRDLASVWHSYVGLAERTASNGLVATFLKSVIPESSFVLDAASGIGCESAVLINAGYAVVSNEIDANLAQVAEELAQKDFGVKLDLRRYLWEELADNLPGGVRFDAVLCLGNSLCLVDSDEGRRRSLQSFRQVLRKGGALIIDERNYRYMIEHRQQIRKSPMTFPAVTKDPMYAGRQVRGMPVEISEQQIVWRLFDADHVRTLSEMKARARGRPLYLYPFKYGELYELLIDAGFSCVTVYADLELVSSGAMPEYAAVQNAVFYTYVAT